MRARNLGVMAGLTALALTGLAIAVGLNTRYFLKDRGAVTLALAAVMATLLALGFSMMRSGMRPDESPTARGWLGAGIVSAAVLTPVVVGIVWWAFFSSGDF